MTSENYRPHLGITHFEDELSERAAPPQSTFDLSDVQTWRELFSSVDAITGETVSEKTALSIPAVAAAVNVIATAIASLPLEIHKKTETGTVKDQAHPLWSIIHDYANDELTSFDWRKHVVATTLLCGRSLTYIERSRAGKIINFYPLVLADTAIKLVNHRKIYTYNGVEYTSDQVIDLVWQYDRDGYTAVNPIHQHRNTFGLAIAAEKFAAAVFFNGGVPPLVLHTPVGSPAAIQRASESVNDAIKAGNNTKNNVLVMPTGTELKAIGLDPEKTQMLELKKFLIIEIARIFSIQPYFLQDLANGNYSNLYAQDEAFLKHTLAGWIANIESELNLKLFGRNNKSGHFVKFDTDQISKADIKTRMESYQKAINSGVMTPNEARAEESLPAKPGGDQLFIQGATVPLNLAGQTPVPVNDNSPDQDGDPEPEA